MKKLVKRILGEDNWNTLVSRVKYAKDSIYFLHAPKFKLNSDWSMDLYSVKNRHSFFGYYDLQQLDANENRLLSHVIHKNAKTHSDVAEIGYFLIEDGSFHKVADTHAWCWQQGARLRWNPNNNNEILFNDATSKSYISKIVDINSKKVVKVFPMALYDVSADLDYGLSLNFSRLQRLRPGYGYDSLPDTTIEKKAPNDDGVFYINLESMEIKLLVSLSELAQQVDTEQKYEHYINHISISPNNKSFMFFHIWNIPEENRWKTRLCVYDLQINKLSILEVVDKVSHYAWKNDYELLVTCHTDDKKQYYAIYDIRDVHKEIISHDGLNKDGHPSFYKSKRKFISDTYPLVHNIQHLFEYDLHYSERKEIIEAYSSSLLYGEKRCDMHPRLSTSENIITFDTTVLDNVRKIVLLRRKNINE